MGNAQRAIDTVSVLDRRVTVIVFAHVVLVALIAHEVSAKAVVNCNATAVHALPIDLSFAVLITNCFTDTDFFQNTVLAEKILGLRLVPLSIVHLLLTVDETAEVRLLAVVALVDGASMIGKLFRLLIINAMLVGKTLILKDVLVLGANQSLADFFLHVRFELLLVFGLSTTDR